MNEAGNLARSVETQPCSVATFLHLRLRERGPDPANHAAVEEACRFDLGLYWNFDSTDEDVQEAVERYCREHAHEAKGSDDDEVKLGVYGEKPANPQMIADRAKQKIMGAILRAIAEHPPTESDLFSMTGKAYEQRLDEAGSAALMTYLNARYQRETAEKIRVAQALSHEVQCQVDRALSQLRTPHSAVNPRVTMMSMRGMGVAANEIRNSDYDAIVMNALREAMFATGYQHPVEDQVSIGQHGDAGSDSAAETIDGMSEKTPDPAGLPVIMDVAPSATLLLEAIRRAKKAFTEAGLDWMMWLRNNQGRMDVLFSRIVQEAGAPEWPVESPEPTRIVNAGEAVRY